MIKKTATVTSHKQREGTDEKDVSELITLEVYDAIREAVLTKRITSFVSAVSGFIGLRWGDKGELKREEEETQQINAVLATLGHTLVMS